MGMEQNCRMTSNESGVNGEISIETMQKYRMNKTTAGILGKSL